MYATASDVVGPLTRLLRPPAKKTVVDTSEEEIKLNIQGAYSGKWNREKVHYMVKPMECLTMREYTRVSFCGPAQCGKTQALVDNFLVHTIVNDPVDVMVVQTTRDEASKFSKTRVERMGASCDAVAEQMAEHGHADNIFDKKYKSGIYIYINWPTKNTFRGKAIPRMLLTDYDAMPDNIGGEGSAQPLAENRIKTFSSRGMVLTESSPAKSVTDANWKAEHPHEAPPTTGILGLFMLGDQHRAYCQCQHCNEYWMPTADTQHLSLPLVDDKPDYASMGLVCDHCGTVNGLEHEKKIKASVRWVARGQTIDSDGVIHGEPEIKNGHATFWLPGWFAAFESWRNLARKLWDAEQEYKATGDEEALKAVYNTGLGGPYIERARQKEFGPEQYKERKDEDLVKGEVPDWVRVLVGSIDVQARRWVVQIEGFGVGDESVIVDRFDIAVSDRLNDDGAPKVVDPATHLEDWNLVEKRVIDREWLRKDGDKMKCEIIGCDMHGVPGVSKQAYAFWKKMRAKGKHQRFRLVRGNTRMSNDFLVKEFVGDIKSGDGAGVPVLNLESNGLKDRVKAAIDRTEKGDMFVHFGDWLEDSWFDELVAETRTSKGRWENPTGKRNESFDLMAYARALLMVKKGRNFSWDNPPLWAQGKKEAPKENKLSSIFGQKTTSNDSWLSK